MTKPIQIPPNEQGMIRVFAITNVSIDVTDFAGNTTIGETGAGFALDSSPPLVTGLAWLWMLPENRSLPWLNRLNDTALPLIIALGLRRMLFTTAHQLRLPPGA